MNADLKPIRTATDYDAGAGRSEEALGAKSGTLEGDRLDILATLIDAYEAVHFPIDPPDPVEAIKFRMEQQGPDAQGPGDLHRYADTVGRGAQIAGAIYQSQ